MKSTSLPWRRRASAWAVAAALLWLQGAAAEPFQLRVVHLNDFAAHVDHFLPSGKFCEPGDSGRCIGGFARVVTVAKQLMQEATNTLLLSAGDSAQGSIWSSVHGTAVAAQALNLLNWDAHVLGSHDFDLSAEQLSSFIGSLNAPVVAANLEAARAPALQGAYEPSVVVERDGRKIGIIGVLNCDTKYLCSSEGVGFPDPRRAVAAEAARLAARGVDVVVALSSAGIETDEAIAREDPHVDLVVGSGRLLLYTGAAPDGSQPYAQYPIVVTQPSGRKVAVVQAGHSTRYLGNLTATFDDEGNLLSAEGNPVYLDHTVIPDEGALSALAPWAAGMVTAAERVVGRSAVVLEQQDDVCHDGECNLGNFVADAFARAFAGKGPRGCWTLAAVAITSARGLRAPIPKGNVTLGDVVRALPYGNSVSLALVRGKSLRRALERSASFSTPPRARRTRRRGLQVSGLQVRFDAWRRLRTVKVLCHHCDVPVYEPLNNKEWYPVAINSYLLGGGDGYDMFTESRVLDDGPLDLDVVLQYLKCQDPVTQARDGRLYYGRARAPPNVGGGNGGSGKDSPEFQIDVGPGENGNLIVDIPKDTIRGFRSMISGH